ncbi:hypothetical protein PTKIN_Ptkin19aG0016500 [Pterospermum kingtungense]
MAELKKEVENDDFILLDIEEYSELPYKTLVVFEYLGYPLIMLFSFRRFLTSEFLLQVSIFLKLHMHSLILSSTSKPMMTYIRGQVA